jgi:hypothetical protein
MQTPFIVQSSGLDGELADTNIQEEDLAASYYLSMHLLLCRAQG